MWWHPRIDCAVRSSPHSCCARAQGAPAHAHETGDWSHVDVYLTKTTDYRMLLLAGSRWEDELLRWCAERGSTVVALGADVEGAAYSLRYEGDDDADVRLLAEVLVAELLAADLWAAQS